MNCISANPQLVTAGLFPTSCSSVLYNTVLLTFTGFLDAFTEAASVIWQHCLQLLEAIKM